MSNSSIWPKDTTLSSATTPGLSLPGGNGNEGVLHIPQSSSITGTSPSNCYVPYAGYSLGRSYSSAEVQLVYSAAPANLAIFIVCIRVSCSFTFFCKQLDLFLWFCKLVGFMCTSWLYNLVAPLQLKIKRAKAYFPGRCRFGFSSLLKFFLLLLIPLSSFHGFRDEFYDFVGYLVHLQTIYRFAGTYHRHF